MTNLLSMIVFTIPGVMAYYFIQLLGVTLGTKNQPSEKLALSIIFWVPITFVTMGIYQLIALLTHLKYLHPESDIIVLKKNWILFDKLSDFKLLMDNYWFIIYFFITSLYLSYLFAKYVSSYLVRKTLDNINSYRKKKNMPLLSSKPSVWEETFINNEIQVVGICHLGTSSEKVYGEIKSISRSIGTERDISLRNQFFWKRILESNNISVVETFINTSSGTVIEVYDLEQVKEAVNNYLTTNKG